MNNLKQLMVEDIKKRLSDSPYVFLAQFTGMNVLQVNELRRRLDAAQAEYHVVKNSLLARATKGAGLALDDNLSGQTAVIFARKAGKAPGVTADPIAAAKALRGYIKEFEKPLYKAGFMEGRPLGAEELAALAELPTRDVLLAKLLGLLNTPAQQLLYVLNAKSCEFLAVLKAYEEKQQTQGKS